MQINARIACDPPGQARFLLRLPNDWNGRLVVAGASGTRSEFNGDFAWSDYVVQKGYAYASQNKGVLNLRSRPPPIRWRAGSIPLPPRVRALLRQRSRPALHALGAIHGQGGGTRTRRREGGLRPVGRAFTYAVGTSNGGYQVRRAVEIAPKLFDGGVDWEGTFVDEHAPNLLTDLPPAILNFPDYVALGLQRRRAPPRRTSRPRATRPTSSSATTSLWGNYSSSSGK